MMEALETVLLIKKKTGDTILSQEIFKYVDFFEIFEAVVRGLVAWLCFIANSKFIFFIACFINVP